MFLDYEVIDMEEINNLLHELAVEDINEQFNTSTYIEETNII